MDLLADELTREPIELLILGCALAEVPSAGKLC